jgi:hypothetical protein
VGIVGVK